MPPAPVAAPGVTLGNFLIEKPLGHGAMGQVFLALQLSMDRRVALKVLPQALMRDERVVERFQREVRMSARLEHPNIVTAYEAGEDFGYHFLAMTYVEGEDLETRRKREGAFQEKDALRAGRQVAEALRYAWEEHKLLHRDVKPSNIMMDASDRARLTDLGISICLNEAQASLTSSGMVIGTPHYMSPEQIRGHELDWRADAYSLGATLYHLMTGNPPFGNVGSAEVINRHLHEPVTPARRRRGSISVGCSELLERMMAKERDDRHRTWDDLLRDFDLVLAGKRPPLPPRPHRAADPPPSGTTPVPVAPPPREASAEERLPPVVQFHPRPARSHTLLRKFLAVLVLLGLAAILAFALVRLWKTRKDDAPQETTERTAVSRLFSGTDQKQAMVSVKSTV
jgi:serine/threonine-protein kinase